MQSCNARVSQQVIKRPVLEHQHNDVFKRHGNTCSVSGEGWRSCDYLLIERERVRCRTAAWIPEWLELPRPPSIHGPWSEKADTISSMIGNSVRIRVVVASQGEARFYDATSAPLKMKLMHKLTDPTARLHDRDLVSDKPGQVLDQAPAAGQRRGSVPHHSTGGERSPRKQEAAVFARQVVQQLESEHRASPFGRLVVMAGPAFLGLLREAMPKSLREITVAEVGKDLLHVDDAGVLAHMPKVAFEPTFKPYYSAHG